MLQRLRRIVLVSVGVCLAYTGLATAVETLTITAPRADVRAGPDIKRSILATVPQDAIFSLLETRPGWYKILLEDGREGWVPHMVAQMHIGEVPALMPSSLAADAQPRLALVIGNISYSADIGPLENAAHDAMDMAAALGRLGFVVTLVLDADRARMVQAVEAFGRQMQPRGIGLFYYSGHGIEGPDGHNYLLPVGAHLSSRVDVPFQGVAADWVLARMEEAGEGGTNIVILDACRNAPFRRLWKTSPGGFAPMYGSGGSLIVYSTSPGKFADDGVGQRNGTYTKHLLRFIEQPGVPVEQTLKQVRLAVEQETRSKNPREPQVPWESSSLRGDFFFQPLRAATATASPAVSSPASPLPKTAAVTRGGPSAAVSNDASPSPGGPVQVAVAPPTPATGAPSAVSLGKDGAEMVLVPASEFLMGSTTEDIERLLRDWPALKRELVEREVPQHRLMLEAFYIDRYEVTNARFRQFVQATGYRTLAEREGWGWVHAGKAWEKVKGATWETPQGPGSTLSGLDQHPVVQVSWEDAMAYCRWADKRLPTEAEWEKAARGVDGRSYPWGGQLGERTLNLCDRHCAMAWKDDSIDDGHVHTAPVGQYSAGKSPYGVYDMAGNVWEWVADWFDAAYYRAGASRNLQGPATGHLVVIRGGSWFNNAALVRAPQRSMENPAYRFSNTGLRCARTS
ncbi:MAG: SUMF1/EgtB/PvdO family nonheme iron enzyme [Candidatus Tectimicrobiota bacterium]